MFLPVCVSMCLLYWQWTISKQALRKYLLHVHTQMEKSGWFKCFFNTDVAFSKQTKPPKAAHMPVIMWESCNISEWQRSRTVAAVHHQYSIQSVLIRKFSGCFVPLAFRGRHQISSIRIPNFPPRLIISLDTKPQEPGGSIQYFVFSYLLTLLLTILQNLPSTTWWYRQ